MKAEGHDWGDWACKRCSDPIPQDLIWKRAEAWATELSEKGDYHALAAYLCANHHHPYNPHFAYSRSVDLWNSKNRRALNALREAGSAALTAMLAEIEAGENKEISVADLLIRIGDPTAVPLLKRLLDKGSFSGYDTKHIQSFISKYPEYHGHVEEVVCAICSKLQPITETNAYEDKRFCERPCWSKRGRILKAGIGTDCPYYDEGVCMAGGRDTGLCSLTAGHYLTSCYVYALHRK